MVAKKKFFSVKSIVVVDQKRLIELEISQEELKRYFPQYILSPKPFHCGFIKKVFIFTIQFYLRLLVKVFLRPRKKSGHLHSSEVSQVYDKEAKTYNRKHHLTTRGMDLVWRRSAGWLVSVIGRSQKEKIKVLDICTGTGLTIKEIVSISKGWGINMEVIGLDFNENMLEIARKEVVASNVHFVQGDAMNMLGCESLDFDLAGTIDVATQVFGIGGIPYPIEVFDGLLKVLKPDAKFLMIDIHKPIPEQPGEWPFFLRWFRFPILEMITFEQSTVPIILNRLWGWHNPTVCFYLLPLVTHKDDNDNWWGFEVEFFEQESQRWWFALPLMPIAKIIVKKVQIDEETARTRIAILNSCDFHQ